MIKHLILYCHCYADCVQDHPVSRSQQLMTFAYSCVFLLIIVALSEINNTIQQDFNWTGYYTEVEGILKGQKIHSSKWKQVEEARSSCFCFSNNNKNLLYNSTIVLHRQILPPFQWAVPFHFASLVSFPTFTIPHVSHFAVTSQIHSNIYRCALKISGFVHYRNNFPAFSRAQLQKSRNSLQNKNKDPSVKWK